MSISTTVSGTTPSSATTALNDNSLVHITGTFEGIVILQAAPAGTSNWLTIVAFEEVGVVPILTPDSTMQYRFLPKLSSGTAIVYFGA